jgi:hypothetical protein
VIIQAPAIDKYESARDVNKRQSKMVGGGKQKRRRAGEQKNDGGSGAVGRVVL